MEKREEFLISEELAEWIGLKKSQYLSKLVERWVPGDISFEAYTLFDSFISNTIEQPDKVYELLEDDQKVRTYVKTFTERSGFNQLVLGVVVEDGKNSAHVFIPILTFVTRSHELVKAFSDGTVISGHLLN
jgi:hypothetical protein